MSFPRYPKYKPSGVEWLGEVPEHWKLTKIRHAAKIVGGGTPSREKLEYWNGTIPWVSPKDMKSERIGDSEEFITELGLQDSSTCLIPAGRILMVIRSGILQHTLPAAINDVPVALNQDLKAFSFDERVCQSRFFLRWVQGLSDSLLLAWANEGATVESLSQTYLRDTTFPVPPLAEQTKIASFLDGETSKIDGLVGEQWRLIELLKDSTKRFEHSLLENRQRFSDADLRLAETNGQRSPFYPISVRGPKRRRPRVGNRPGWSVQRGAS